MPALEDLVWTTNASAADWIAQRLRAPTVNAVTSVVPSGFEAYARILHPVEDPSPGGRRLVRWRDVAAWSGRPLTPHSPFYSVALPEHPVRAAPPWSGRPPRRGCLEEADADALLSVVRRHTRTPDDCWFCLWEGHDWRGAPLTSNGHASGGRILSDPLPPEIRAGGRVQLPERSYFLYRGPVEAATVAHGSLWRSANLWWPEDRSWFVASEVGLSWTYVAGSVALVRALTGDPGLEAVEISPDDPVAVLEPRIAALVEPAVEALLGDRRATVTTPVGTVEAHLRLPTRTGRGSLSCTTRSVLGKSGESLLALPRRRRRDAGLRDTVARHLQTAVIGLVDC